MVFVSFGFAIAGCGGTDEDVPVPRPGGSGLGSVEIEVQDTVWTLGVLDGAPEETFGSIRAGTFDPDGNVYLLDRAYGVIRVFEPMDGGFLRAFGGPGRGPGELQDPRAMLHDGEERLYVLDRANGLLIFQVTSEAIRFERSINLPGADITNADDFCLLRDRIYVYSAEGPVRGMRTDWAIVHEFTDTGQWVRSFGELFGEPEGHAVQVRHYSRPGMIACSARHDGVLVGALNTGEVRLYRDGVLNWVDSIPDFLGSFVQVDPAGLPRNAGAYWVGDIPGAGGREYHQNLLALDPDMVLVQSRFSGGSDSVWRVCPVGFASGACAARREGVGRLLAVAGSRALSLGTHPEEDHPVVSLIAIRTELIVER